LINKLLSWAASRRPCSLRFSMGSNRQRRRSLRP